MAAPTGEVRIERLVAGGDGLAHLDDGRVVFVPGAFPGDLVTLEGGRGKKRWARADRWSLVEPSPDRVEPPCRWADRCGGCDWMGLDVAAQRRAKAAIVAEALRRTGRLQGVPETIEVVSAGPELGWRTRLRLHVVGGRVGFFARGSHDIVPVDRCVVADPRVVDEMVKVAADPPDSDLVTIQVDRDGTTVYTGPAPFSQANPWVNERLVADVVSEASACGSRFLELYAGSGNFSLALARAGLSGVTVESHGAAVKEARASAAVAGLDSVLDIRVADAAAVPAVAGVDVVVLDPPRAGARDALEGIVRLDARHIGYVSCDPVTLARDLSMLQGEGYRLRSVLAYDMFPHTHHVETVAWMERTPARPRRGAPTS